MHSITIPNTRTWAGPNKHPFPSDEKVTVNRIQVNQGILHNLPLKTTAKNTYIHNAQHLQYMKKNKSDIAWKKYIEI